MFRVSIRNEKLSLPELEQVYVTGFRTERKRKLALSILKVVYENCELSPFDATLRYPDGSSSSSSLGMLLRFFVNGGPEAPVDSRQFLLLLKSVGFKASSLPMVKVWKK